MSKRKVPRYLRDESPKTDTEIKITLHEHYCGFCEKTCYADIVNRCPYCGSTSEVRYVRSVTLVEKK